MVFKMKKIVSLLLSALLIITIIPLSSITASAAIYSGTCGENLTWEYDDETGTLTISGNGAMTDYCVADVYDRAPWNNYSSLIKKVVISEGITTIGAYAFEHCSNLTEAILPTTITNICEFAFEGCGKLKDITLPNNLISIGSHAFNDCTGLSEIIIPDNVELIGDRAFKYCTGLKNVTIGNGVKSINIQTFMGCTGLIEVTIGKNINSIEEWAFVGCANLKTVNNYSSLQIIKGTTDYGDVGFYADTVNWYAQINGSCGADLIYKFDTAIGQLTIGGTGAMDNYTDCLQQPWYEFRTLIESVVIGENVTSINNNAFYGCENLKTVENYSGIYVFKGKTDNGYVGYYAQTVNNYNAEPNGKCGENVIWSLDRTTGVLKIEGTGEMEFYNLNIYPEAYYSEPPWYGLRDLITSVEISDGVTSIGNFADCINLTKITIPQSVTNIFEYAFYNCSNLEEITIPEKVEYIGNCTFENCTKLSKVTFNEGIIHIMQRAFYNCTSLKEINFPNSLWQIWNHAFGNCIGLEKITVGSENEYFYVQNNCLIDKETKALVLGCKTSIIPDDVIAIGEDAFYGCTGLTEITIPSSVTNIDDNAFYGCVNLKTVNNYSEIYIYKGKTDNGYVGFYAETVNNFNANPSGECGENLTWSFDEDTGILTISGSGNMADYVDSSNTPWYDYRDKIKEVIIGDGVAAIGSYAFYNCIGLTEITIPSGVTAIGSSAFYGCENLKTVNNHSNLPTVKGGTSYGYVGYYADTVNWYGTTTGNCGDNATYTFDASIGKLILNGSGKMTDYEWFQDTPWYNYDDLIKSIEICNGITSVSKYAFYGCTNLNEVIMPDSVTDIGAKAFAKCWDLSKITLSNSVISIGESAFMDCESLTEIIIPNAVSGIGEDAFRNCDNLKKVYNYSNLVIVKGSDNYGYLGFYAENIINVSSPVANIVTDNTVVLEYPELTDNYGNYGMYEFKVNDGEWQESNIFTGLLPNTVYTFYKRLKSDNTVNNYFVKSQIITLVNSDYVIPVSVEVKDATVKWGSNIYSEYVFLNDGYYSIVPEEVIVTYSDGSQNKYLYPDTYGLIRIFSGLENCKDWNVGDKHLLKGVYYCGGDGLPEYQLFYEVNVTVIESDIEKIEYSNVKVIENFKNDEGNYDYYPQITVYYKNGTIEVFDFPNGIAPEWYLNAIQGIGPLLQVGLFPIYSDTQSVEPWQVGESYTVTASFMGFSDEFTVTVIENPIKDIIVKTDILYFEDGEKTDTDGVYRFYPTYDFKFELLLNDGEIGFVEPICEGFIFSLYNSPHYGESWIEALELKLGENIGSVYFNIFGRQWKADYCINLISKKVSEPICTESTDSTVTLKNTDGYEYSKDGINWQTSNVFEGLNPNTEYTFYQRIAETLTHNASESSEALKMKTDKTSVAKPTVPTLYGKTDTSVTLTAKTGYEYKMDNGAWQSSNVFAGLLPNKTYSFYQRIAATNTAYASESSNALTITTNKSSVAKPSAPTYSSKTDTTVTLTAKSGYEYSKDCTIWQDSNVFTEISPNTTYNFYQRVKETDTNYASESSEPLTVTTTRSLTEIKVTTKPNKLIYLEGESLDTSGMVVTAYYNDNNNELITDYQISGYTSTVGVKTITVSYNGKTASFNVTVNTRVPSSITSNTHKIEGNTISKINLGTTVNSLLSGLSAGQYCKVYKGNSEVAGTSKVGTGMVVKIMDSNTVKASYTVVVTGDTNGDGDITITDMLAIKAHVLKKSTLSGAYATAADTSGDGGVTITDFIQVKAKILGKGNIVAR